MKKLLLITIVCAGAVPVAQGQTGRIAHFSHGGSAATLVLEEEAKDNFGYPAPEVKIEKIIRLNDSLARMEGQERSYGGKWKAIEFQYKYYYPGKTLTPAQAMKYLREEHSDAKFIGFDSTRHANRPLHRPKEKLIKPSSRSQMLPRRPFQYSFWREATSIAGLGLVGWLLGRKRPA